MNLIKSPLNALLNQSGIPTLANGGTPPPVQATQPAQQPIQLPAGIQTGLSWAANRGGHGVRSKYSPNPFQYSSDNIIQAYRHDPKGRFGGKEGLETQATGFNADLLQAYAKAVSDAKLHGGRTLTPEQLMTLALVEGRSDYGYNEFDLNDKRAVKLAENLIAQGHNPDAAGFAAAIDNKLRTAERLGIPFAVAWNGTGRGSGGTGRDYARRFDAAHNAGIYEHPKNALLYEAVQNGFLPDEEKATMPQVDAAGNPIGFGTTETRPYKKGGSVAKEKAFLKFHKK